ncbi:hypothetical protein K493DRAFT_412096 [Basidiobolus meristosporus CBS 931.73]|uniref:Uncharacterized protein n=1 Tax=Basidiobolus meristosporus CBS 931.73 TaxID=1314790 RepID=A0A1Y1X527_9FUNG|nr:hypothetical protein K493DRAFT_412096 [Basidiobolus meristosporus CBS 931.73]|eukprot:ORX80745.1 hypothetical protein K493DRAFT_412096 [Basidiobolus meristosporus CBS 931.73]
MEKNNANHDPALAFMRNKFQHMEDMGENGELRPFGKNSDAMFEKLDIIRQQQIALAVDHIMLENGNDSTKRTNTTTDTSEGFNKTTQRFLQGAEELERLMVKLDDLGKSMAGFHELTTSLNEPTQN